MDKIKFGFALLLLVGGVAGFYYLNDSPMVVRVISVLAGLLLAVAVAWSTEQGKRFYGFARESSEETRKVVWPSRKETLQTTGVVFAFVVVMALFLWTVDASLMIAIKYLMGQGG